MIRTTTLSLALIAVILAGNSYAQGLPAIDIDSGEILFVDKNSEPWQIAAYDPQTSVTRVVMPLFPATRIL